MTHPVTVGELIARFLESAGVQTAFGVISIHNMPILDAIGRRGKIHFVTARSEPGAVNMADAYARVHGSLGVAISSTGTAAGNACGGMVEAQTAGTPLLHLTGQIESAYLDRGWAYLHEARDQLAMLSAVSKKAFRIWSADTALGVLRDAVHCALSPPSGPVSIEIPIDVQHAELPLPPDLSLVPLLFPRPNGHALDELAHRLSAARRPLLWLGGGARSAGTAAARLVELGFGAVTSVQGRGIVPETDPMSLGAFTYHGAAQAFYRSCDAMLVVGSQLRGNETLKYELKLPRPLYRIDAEAARDGRGYRADFFVAAEASLALDALADRLRGQISLDPSFRHDLAQARERCEADVYGTLGPYRPFVDALRAAVGGHRCIWVRDVTVSNSVWGNRSVPLHGPRDGVHAVGGGIGQGMQMALGAALAARDRKVLCLCGDGGFMVNAGELATLAEENANVALMIMNDRGYGVIRNIQDAQYGGRRYFAEPRPPDFEKLCAALNVSYRCVKSGDDLAGAVSLAAQANGPSVTEIDMVSIGPYASAFTGPPVSQL